MNILPYKNSKIAWYRFGNGEQKVVCFHGYGETAESFAFLEKHGLGKFSFYAIDLPFHGHTEWNERLSFTENDLAAIVNTILKGERNWSLIGFSLGGRVALSLYQAIPESIRTLVFLAPDGLKENFWYKLATGTSGGNRFFRFTMKHPSWFFGMLKGLSKLKLVNRSIFKFVNNYISDEKVRGDLYARWTSLRKLKPDISRIRSLISENKTPVTLIYGKHDRIILHSVGEKFKKGIEEYCEVKVIQAGHQVMQEKYAGEIILSLKRQNQIG